VPTRGLEAGKWLLAWRQQPGNRSVLFTLFLVVCIAVYSRGGMLIIILSHMIFLHGCGTKYLTHHPLYIVLFVVPDVLLDA